MSNNMSAVEMLATSKAVAEKNVKAARSAMDPGTYPVDVTVRLSGAVTVGEDTDKASTSSLVSEAFLILALKMSGCTRERSIQIIEGLASEFVGSADRDAAKAARDAAVAEFDADGAMRALFTGLKARMPRTPVSGAVKFVGEVEVIAAASAEKAA